jgi:galactose mutarotase-like enzyme
MPVHSISNKKISISVNTAGAELTSFKSDGTELLWQADKTIWPRYAPVLFPIVGKLKDNSYTYHGSTYNLGQHGFARDKEFSLIHQTQHLFEFELRDNKETFAVFPFQFSLRITYELNENALMVRYAVMNPGNEALLFSIGAHPGFNCKRVPGETLSDLYLEFENKTELEATVLKDGLLSDELNAILLDNGKLDLNPSLFENDALVFKNRQIEKVTLSSKRSPVKISLQCKDWPYFGIWSKKGSDAFVCLEPWYGITSSMNPDPEIASKEGIITLGPNKSFETRFIVSV